MVISPESDRLVPIAERVEEPNEGKLAQDRQELKEILQKVSSSPPTTPVSVGGQVVLNPSGSQVGQPIAPPLSEEQTEKALRKKVGEAAHWLAVWTIRRIKQAWRRE